ncbi:hypothetical protein [Photobacterium leiognathi]|uniref:hypothetical protein n=1 Tax=Photobacterium leiognathi TaxID=553611 RepID=UPI002981BD8C|nr:hypothetical protein [Photobacterium leiognathi]
MHSFVTSKISNILRTWKDNDPKNVEFYEPINDKTLKHKRVLLIASISIIVIKTLGIEVDSILGIKFTKINDVSEIAGIIFWVVLYELITFILSFWADIKSWDFKRSVFKSEEIIRANKNLTYHIWKISQSLSVHYKDISSLRALSHDLQAKNSELLSKMSYLTNSLDNIVGGAEFDRDTKTSLQESVNMFMKLISEIDSTKKILRLKKFITYIMDFLIPVVVAIFSILLSYSDGLSIISRVFGE